jgi:hypothetical protein
MDMTDGSTPSENEITWPSSASWAFFREYEEESWPVLDIGVVRDSALDTRNPLTIFGELQIFEERLPILELLRKPPLTIDSSPS